jgi:hypothetical protein
MKLTEPTVPIEQESLVLQWGTMEERMDFLLASRLARQCA